MLLSASMDILTMTIPNKISLALIAGFLVLAPFVGLGWVEFAQHIGVGLALLVIGIGYVCHGLDWRRGCQTVCSDRPLARIYNATV